MKVMRNGVIGGLVVSGLLGVGYVNISFAVEATQNPAQYPFDATGTVHIPAGTVPLSAYMSAEAKKAFMSKRDAATAAEWERLSEAQRYARADEEMKKWLEHEETLYAVTLTEKEIGNVSTTVIEPKEGVPARNRHRVLIDLHGGSYGPRSGGPGQLLQAVPIAGYGKFSVISINYRLLPKYRFPAPVEDVTAVYRALLKTHKAQSIGIYGCSTGAALAGEVISWFQKVGLPRPGAVGIFCEGAIKDDQIEGDSYYVASALAGGRFPAVGETFPPGPAMLGTDDHDPLVAPISSLEVLAKFPPTLLISGTRDMGLSGVLVTHSRLVKAGAEADLHVWDGMWHGFFSDPDFPESREAYEVITRFFGKHLASR